MRQSEIIYNDALKRGEEYGRLVQQEDGTYTFTRARVRECFAESASYGAKLASLAHEARNNGFTPMHIDPDGTVRFVEAGEEFIW